jgi:hypothetical protein
MDCQIIMSVFVAVYRTTFFLRNKHATVAQILSQVRDPILSVPVCAKSWVRLLFLQCHPRFTVTGLCTIRRSTPFRSTISVSFSVGFRLLSHDLGIFASRMRVEHNPQGSGTAIC